MAKRTLLWVGLLLLSTGDIFCLKASRLFDYVTEGGEKVEVSITKNMSDPALKWSFIPRDTQDIKFRKTHSGLQVYAPEDEKVEGVKRYILIALHARTGETLLKMSFIVIDNDGPGRRIGEMGRPVKFRVQHKKSPHHTEYIIQGFTGDFFLDWEFAPLKLVFQPNETGTALLLARPKDDDIVEGTERYILILKKISNGIISYVQSKIVDIVDNDVPGIWSDWSPMGECAHVYGTRCLIMMSRECTLPRPQYNPVTVHCNGDDFRTMSCDCPSSH